MNLSTLKSPPTCPNNRTHIFLSVFSAALVAASFPPSHLGWAAWIALTPFFLALRAGSVRQVIFLSFLFAYLHGIIVFRWLPSVDGVGYPVFLLLLAPIYSLYYAAFGVSYRLVAGRFPRLTFLAAPAFWVAMEYARANMGFLALPWNLLGHTQHELLPFIGIADITGIYGISFLLVMVSEVLSRWLEAAYTWKLKESAPRLETSASLKVYTGVTTLALVLVVCYSLVKIHRYDSHDTIRIALLQPNILLKEDMKYKEVEQHLETYSKFTRTAAEGGADLIAWPASSLPGSLNSRSVRIKLSPILRDLDTSLLLGGAGGQKMAPAEGKAERYANSEFLLRPSRRPGGIYHKQRLVPFNEYLPLKGIVSWPRWITTLEGGYRPGSKHTVFVLKEGRFGVPICWESLFPGLFRRFVKEGANFMVNVTNEAYMGDSAGPYQTHAMNVFRAVENRVTLARVSATGISSFIGPDGRVLDRVQDETGKHLFVEGILVRDIPLSSKRTFYTMYGDIFAWSMIAITLVSMVLLTRKKPIGEN